MPKIFLNNYFGFNKQQRSGLFVLMSVSLLLMVIRLVYPVFIKANHIVLLNLPLFEKQLDSSYTIKTNFSKNQDKNETTKLNLFVFDPNKVSANQLQQLGLKEKTIQVFLKFRNKGFTFKEKTDLMKVYGITQQIYSKLEPYILIDVKVSKQDPSNFSAEKTLEIKPTKQIVAKLDLNSIDSVQLIALSGIGGTYAKRILKYRTVLGGFTKVDQLKEVYGFNENLFEKTKDNFYVDQKIIRKINLNKDDFKAVNKHPYITYELTKQIFEWRKKTAITPENLKDILNDSILYQKLLPYLSFE